MKPQELNLKKDKVNSRSIWWTDTSEVLYI